MRLEQVTGVSVPTILGERRAGDLPALMSDASRAHEILDWHPKISELDESSRGRRRLDRFIGGSR
jgi:UDP-glucose 4-epimerase